MLFRSVAVYADEGDAVRVRGIVVNRLDRTLRMPFDPLLERGLRYLRSSEIDLPTNDGHCVSRLRLHDVGDVAYFIVERALDEVERSRPAVQTVVPGVDVAVRKLRGDRRPPDGFNVLAIGVPAGAGSQHHGTEQKEISAEEQEPGSVLLLSLRNG